jgi:hypothetical protein
MQAISIINYESFDIVVNELVNMGEVSIGYLRDGEKVLKFKVLF